MRGCEVDRGQISLDRLAAAYTQFHIVCPSTNQSLTHSQTKRSLIFCFHLRLVPVVSVFSQVFRSQRTHATCPANPVFLHLIASNMFGEEYKPQSSSIRNFPQSPVSLSLFGPNTSPSPSAPTPSSSDQKPVDCPSRRSRQCGMAQNVLPIGTCLSTF